MDCHVSSRGALERTACSSSRAIFMDEPALLNFVRLGFSSLPAKRIAPGIQTLAKAYAEMTLDQPVAR